MNKPIAANELSLRKIVLTGASGFIGNSVACHLLRKGYELTSIVRNARAGGGFGKLAEWPLEASGGFQASTENPLLGATAVIHLAGHPVADSRWTTSTKKKIYDSRISSTKQIVSWLSQIPAGDRPKALLCASAIGYYGNRGDELLNEESSSGQGFLAEVTKAWEKEAAKAEALGVRVVHLRFGVVLGAGGGALKKMQPVILGSGKQWMSWVHIDDVVAAIRFCLENFEVKGPVNVVGPSPVTNREFTKSFAKSRGGKFVARAPEIAIRTAVGEMSQIVLESAKVEPQKLLAKGYIFQFKTLESALSDIYKDLSPLEEKFLSKQFIPIPLKNVFEFFSKAENLETITPPWLKFKITKKSSLEMEDKTLIDYRLKIHGIPVVWQSRIEKWTPNKEFIDVQTKGPYSKWHHRHSFEEVPGGTLVLDEVIYRVPGGRIGSVVGGSFIRKDIEKIFEFRSQKIGEVLN